MVTIILRKAINIFEILRMKKGFVISTSVPREVFPLMKYGLGLHDNKIIMYRCFVQNLEFAHL